jgi:hypothetical protein
MPAVIVAVLLQIASFSILYVVFTRRIRFQLSKGQILEEIRDEVHGLIVEMNQTADRNVGLAEERIKRLQVLISESDKKIQLLSREIEKHQVGVDVYEKLKESSRKRVLSSESTSAGNIREEKISYDPVISTSISPSIDNRESKGTEADGKIRETDVDEDVDTLSDRVVRLARQGFGSRIIAQKLDSSLGEVELILSLQSGRDGKEA